MYEKYKNVFTECFKNLKLLFFPEVERVYLDLFIRRCFSKKRANKKQQNICTLNIPKKKRFKRCLHVNRDRDREP